MKAGDIVEFRRKGFVSWILGGLLRLFNPGWDGWGWHMAICYCKALDGIILLEATGQGVKINWYNAGFIEKNCRVWEWFIAEPTPQQLHNFIGRHIDRKYDIAIYFWTTLAVIVRHYFNRPISKLLDRRFSCWELAQEFTAEMGKPILSMYDVVVITDIVKALKEGSHNA